MTSPWQRFQQFYCSCPEIELSLDISRIALEADDLAHMEPAMQSAFAAMDALEKGAIANPDENRMVGHYWLRNSQLAPTSEIRTEIEDTLKAIHKFVTGVHAGAIKPPGAERFSKLLSIGIGGSALGPMFVHDALGQVGRDLMEVHFIDNTDPDGMARTMQRLAGRLERTLCLVISKSGGTPETRNGMLTAQAAWQAGGLDFAKHAVAITGTSSHLDQQADREKWLARFPMWDWVGGRTSELSAVGLLPAALQGIDIDAMLAGAAACDEITRRHETLKNPAALLALSWFIATGGRGNRDMVVLPYKDRLLLLSRYLQQLVMESLGKRLNLKGERVDQGIAVYGNKGSTDQHAYVQQLRDGVNNFFVTFIRVLTSGGEPLEVEPGATAGDFLHGLLLGTREALWENDRPSITVAINKVDAKTIGVLIALFERAVGFYGSLVGINAYHQPGVEAGKKAAAGVLALQRKIAAALSPAPQTADQLAAAIGALESAETVFLLLEHLAANGRAKVAERVTPAKTTWIK
ncbi:MAG: glucose-6-phosphate isomerase [Planctomycetes bacterium]|nr:glucose-6-phosphate isomerase [Planctomycetota bacterium]